MGENLSLVPIFINYFAAVFLGAHIHPHFSHDHHAFHPPGCGTCIPQFLECKWQHLKETAEAFLMICLQLHIIPGKYFQQLQDVSVADSFTLSFEIRYAQWSSIEQQILP